MTDVLTLEQRRKCMASIRSRDTRPEMIVRKMVHAMGYRYRLHLRDLPGKPDLVFSRIKKVIFVHGCFWHKHKCRYGRVQPKTNADFWISKREFTRLRDFKNMRKLREMGWGSMIIWECWTKDNSKHYKIEQKIATFLTQLRQTRRKKVEKELKTGM